MAFSAVPEKPKFPSPLFVRMTTSAGFGQFAVARVIAYWRPQTSSFSFGRSGMNEIKLRMFYRQFLKKPLPSIYIQQVQ